MIIHPSVRHNIEQHEISAAQILLSHFGKDIVFLPTENNKTPDLLIGGLRWELKSPKGGAKHTMGNNLNKAKRQSQNIIIDLSRTKLDERRAISQIKHYLIDNKYKIKRIKVITKLQKIIDIL